MFFFGQSVVIKGEAEDGIVISEGRTEVQIAYCCMSSDSDDEFSYSIRTVNKDKVRDA